MIRAMDAGMASRATNYDVVGIRRHYPCSKLAQVLFSSTKQLAT